MNDAHIYCTKDQFADEFRAVNEMYLKYFGIFGIDKYVMRLSLHDPAKLGKKYIDEPQLWLETEELVRSVLKESGIPYVEVPDEGAFYGPKIDVQIWSAIGREFTLATNQVDFAQGRRFDLGFTNKDNETESPLIIHRAPLGTHERFIGFLLEHYAGRFPLWLAPEQVRILTISERFLEHAKKVQSELVDAGLRAEVDDRSEKIGKKIRDAELAKVPYMFVIGEKEAESGSVSVRRQGKGDAGIFTLSEIILTLTSEYRNRH
jgi:threonyl-tRNA synthetase